MPTRTFTRHQMFALPANLDEIVGNDHIVRFVVEFVEQHAPTVWAEHGWSWDAAPRGAPRYAPEMLVCAWVYGFMIGERSSRGIERACQDRFSVCWLTGNQQPDHNTLWRFYQAHGAGMRTLFMATVKTAVKAGLVDLAVMAVDGTKLRANAAAERSLDAKELAALLARTETAIADLEAQSGQGDGPLMPTLPAQLRTQAGLRTRIQTALAQVQAEGGPSKANVTDPDARFMKSRNGLVPAYNAQAAVVRTSATARAILGPDAPGGRIIVAASVITDGEDNAQLVPMIAAATEMVGAAIGTTVADAGYHSGEALAAASTAGYPVVVAESSPDEVLAGPYHKDRFRYDAETDTYTCPQGQRMTYRRNEVMRGVVHQIYRGTPATCRACPAFGKDKCTRDRRRGRALKISVHNDHLQAQRQRRRDDDGIDLMARRKTLIEPVFGIIKGVQRAQQVLTRGQPAVEREWITLATAFNLRTLARIWQAGLADP